VAPSACLPSSGELLALTEQIETSVALLNFCARYEKLSTTTSEGKKIRLRMERHYLAVGQIVEAQRHDKSISMLLIYAGHEQIWKQRTQKL